MRHLDLTGLSRYGLRRCNFRQGTSSSTWDRIAAGTAEIIQGDLNTLHWPDGSFTIVTSMESFAAFPDPGVAVLALEVIGVRNADPTTADSTRAGA